MMPLELVKLDARYLELKARGETYTLFSPLVEYLSMDPDVEYVVFDVGHPLLEDVTFKLKTRNGTPLEALRRAAQAILRDLDALEKSILTSR
ncbi:MAG: DNA-directed RNA polymerase subunit L [Thermoproteus sp.]|nr:DNA-directed RNA polymerase subunit L [Thermoproteus sp.]